MALLVPCTAALAESAGDALTPVYVAAGQARTPPASAPLFPPTVSPSTAPQTSSPPPATSPSPVDLPSPAVPGSSRGAPSPGAVSGEIVYSEGQPQPNEITISQALDESLMKSPRAAAIRAQYPVAKAGLAQATVAPNPVMFLDRGFVAEQVRRVGPLLVPEPPWKILFRFLAAQSLYKQTKTDLLTTLWALRADVRRAYTELVMAQESRRTLFELYELTERLFTVAQKRFQAGDVPELDVLRAQLAMSQSSIDLAVGEQRLIRARQQLNVILGRTVLSAINVPLLPAFLGPKPPVLTKAVKAGILPDYAVVMPQLDELVELSVTNRLELKSLAQQFKVNQANLRNAFSAAVPNPTLALGASSSGNAPSGPKTNANFLTLNVETPMTNLNQGDVAKFQATERQLKYQLASQKNQIVGEVSSAYNNLLAARGKIREYQEHVLRESSEVARLSRRSYEVGQTDINATLLAQQANIQIRQQYLDGVQSYQQSFTDLEQATGRPLRW